MLFAARRCKLILLLTVLLPGIAVSKQAMILFADPIILKFSDGSALEVNALAEVQSGTVRTHLIVNGQAVAKKSVPPGNEFKLNYDEDDISIRAICKMSGAGMLRDPRGLGEVYPVVCQLKMNGENLGKLVVQHRAEKNETST